MTPATQAVLGIPELFEMVVGNLGYHDIKNTRNVSSSWRDKIDSSVTLARKQFLEPDESSRGRDIYTYYRGESMTLTGHFAPPQRPGDASWDLPSAHVANKVIEGHPNLTFRTPEAFYLGAMVEVEFPYTLDEMFSWPRGGSWERALLSQPPCREIHIMLCGIDHYRHHGAPRAPVRNNQGVRMKDVVDHIRALAFTRQPRAAKKSTPRFDLSKCEKVLGIIEDVVLPGEHWVQCAEWFVEIDREMEERENTAAMKDMAEDVATDVDAYASESAPTPEQGQTTADTSMTDAHEIVDPAAVLAPVLRRSKRKAARRYDSAGDAEVVTGTRSKRARRI